jgi:4'-phosphopantetheinyl transferase
MISKNIKIYGLENLNDEKKLADEDIHLWLIDIKHKWLEDHFQKQYGILNEREKEKYSRYVLEKHKKRFVCSRSILKLLVADYLNIETNSVLIKYNERGKPFLEDNINYKNLYFNISHSYELITIVFTLENLIGVDIEYIDKSRDIIGIAKKFFSNDEYNCINKYKDESRFRMFYIFWTFKEALLKCCGTGISSNFKSISMPLIENYYFMNNKNGSCSYFNKIWKYNILEICNEYITNIVYG